MSTKHVFDDANGLVEKALVGVAAANPSLRVYAPHKVLYDAQHPRDQVAIIAGGGAGHEPSFSGLTGKGLVTVSVSGDVFASPSTVQVCTGIDLAPTDKGVVVVVMNYTGDCLNFGLAAEKARSAFKAEGKGRRVEMVVVGDDVSVGRSKGGLVGRRGLVGSTFVVKALGAGSAKGMDVSKLGELGRTITEQFVTVGSSLDHCHVPGRSTDPEERGAMGPQAIELGMGIHNEQGVKLMEKKPDADALIKEMLDLLLNQDDKERAFVKFDKSDDPVLVVNNLGGMSTVELSAIAGLAVTQLRENWGLRPARVFIGTYITSLNAPGFNLSLLNHKAVSKKMDVDLLELLDAPTDAPSWTPGTKHGWDGEVAMPLEKQEEESKSLLKKKLDEGHAVSAKLTDGSAATQGPKLPDAKQASKVVDSLCAALIDVEPTLTKYDTVVGDGDAGETLRHCAEAVQKAIKEDKISFEYATGAVLGIQEVLESAMGGTSGAIYAIYLTGLVQGLLQSEGSETVSVKDWANAAAHALEGLHNYTPARPGDRTLVDALDPFCRTLKKEADGGKDAKDALKAAVDAAKEGAEATRDMTARLGRATYVGETSEKVPDPGAWGIWALVKGVSEAL